MTCWLRLYLWTKCAHYQMSVTGEMYGNYFTVHMAMHRDDLLLILEVILWEPI